MKAKLRSHKGPYSVEVEGDNGERVRVWLAYLDASATLVVRISGEHGDGEISVENEVREVR